MTTLSNRKINENLNTRSQLLAKIDELKRQVALMEDEIKDYMDSENLEFVQTDLYKVYFEEQVATRFDKAKFIKKYGEDKFLEVSKQTTSKPFKVYPIKK